MPTTATWEVFTEWFTQCESGYTTATTTIALDGTAAATGEQLLSIDLTEENRVCLLQQVASFAQERAGEFQSKRRIKMARQRARGEKKGRKRRAMGEDAPVAVAVGEGEEGEEGDDGGDEEDEGGEGEGEEEGEEEGEKEEEVKPAIAIADEDSYQQRKHQRKHQQPYPKVDEAEEWRKFDAWVSQFAEVAPPSSSSLHTGAAPSSSSSSSSSSASSSAAATATITAAAAGAAASSSSSSSSSSKVPCPYDVIVDGANVGYYKQNFAGAPKHIDYRQVRTCTCA